MSRFTPASAPIAGSTGGTASGRVRRANPRRQIAELQEVAHRDAIADATPVGVKASLMRAYVDLQEIAMALRGHGKPKPVEARNATPKGKRASATVVYPAPSAASAPSVVNDGASKPAS